jgi:hypothetical protein
MISQQFMQASESDIIKEFKVIDATMSVVVNEVNKSIKNNQISAIKSIHYESEKNDVSIAIKELNLKNIPIKELIKVICNNNEYYYEYSSFDVVVIRKSKISHYNVSDKYELIKIYKKNHPEFNFSERAQLIQMLRSYKIIKENETCETYYRDSSNVRLEIYDYRAKILDSIIMLYENGYDVVSMPRTTPAK